MSYWVLIMNMIMRFLEFLTLFLNNFLLDLNLIKVVLITEPYYDIYIFSFFKF
jgi:hypothetical protein